MLVINKADFLSVQAREVWASYFKANNISFVFFSAAREQARLDELAKQNREAQRKLDEKTRTQIKLQERENKFFKKNQKSKESQESKKVTFEEEEEEEEESGSEDNGDDDLNSVDLDEDIVVENAKKRLQQWDASSKLISRSDLLRYIRDHYILACKRAHDLEARDAEETEKLGLGKVDPENEVSENENDENEDDDQEEFEGSEDDDDDEEEDDDEAKLPTKPTRTSWLSTIPASFRSPFNIFINAESSTRSQEYVNVGMVGFPNVGKSSTINVNLFIGLIPFLGFDG